MNFVKTTIIATAAFVTIGCAADDPNRRAKAGAAIGALTGAVIGNQTSSKNGKVVGAARNIRYTSRRRNTESQR